MLVGILSYLTKKVTPEGACRATNGTRIDLSTVVPAATINILHAPQHKSTCQNPDEAEKNGIFIRGCELGYIC